MAGVSAAIMVDAETSGYGWRNALMASALGIPLFLTIALVTERRVAWSLPRALGPVANLLGAALLAAHGLLLPAMIRAVDQYLFLQLAVGLHFAVATCSSTWPANNPRPRGFLLRRACRYARVHGSTTGRPNHPERGEHS